MAAYTALVSLMNLMDDIRNHPRVSTSLDSKQLDSLGEKLDFLLNFLERYHSHGRGKEDEDLESRIASEVHAVEDAIESHIVDLLLSGSTADVEASSKPLLNLQDAVEVMYSFKNSIVEIESERELRNVLPEYSSTRSLTKSNTATVGFDDELIQLAERLIQPEPDRKIIPIVGMGGTGKTTLARLVYEHSLLSQHFDIRMWATISQQYRMEDIFSELLFGEKKPTNRSVNELGQMLHKKLWGRRYLVVLDDMWSLEIWNEIQLFLPAGNGNGGRIVITTRLLNMAAQLSNSPFGMKFLDEEKSWRLFCAKAFGEEECPPELEEVGRDIARKCKGLALSIVVTGGHLGKSSRMKGYWESVRNDINSVLDSEEDECLGILSLSYNHLPPHLKPCFLYMGVFEEDKAISARRLAILWIAEGLLNPNKGKTKEETAEEYLEELVDRNLILVDGRDIFGKFRFCKVHDLLRELSIKISKKENFFCVLHTTQNIDGERRVVIHKKTPENFSHKLDRIGKSMLSKIHDLLRELSIKIFKIENLFHAPRLAPLVRSLKCEGNDQSSNFRLLRVVIDQVKVPLNGSLFEPGFQQVNLRFLDCRILPPTNASGDVPRPTLYLPPSISLIWNLQTLIIAGAYDKIVAPSEIWKMPQLRILDVSPLCLPDPPRSNGLDRQDDPLLQNLRVLKLVENLSLNEDVCKRIPNINQLDLNYNCERGSDEASLYYCPHNLGCFHKLESLSCRFSGSKNWYHFASNFTFPRSLQKLFLSEFPLRWDDLLVISSLPHLVELKLLNSVFGLEWNPVDLGFPCLKLLFISGCRDLVYWNADSSHFPVLESICLMDARKLEEIPSDIGEIPTLRRITLYGCSESAAISAARILVEQEELGNDGLQVQLRFVNKEKLEVFTEMLQEEGLTSNNLHLRLITGQEIL